MLLFNVPLVSISCERTSCSVTTSLVNYVPAKVMIDFLSGKSIGVIPLSIADHLIRHTFEPYSNKTRNKLRLCTKSIVLAMQIVAGVSFL